MSFITNIDFLHPQFFSLLLLIPIIGAWHIWKFKERNVTLKISSLQSLVGYTSWRGKLRTFLLPLLKILAFTALVTALARPQETLKEEEIKAEGIDIALVIDLSSSMLARDFQPDRLAASKKVASDFVGKRQFDRISLAVFAGEAYTQCPLTTDHGVVQQFLAGIQCGILQDGTAIGMGLATAVNRLKDSKVESKIVILLTDGVNNTGYIQPLTAAEIAQEFGIKVYTIGVGSEGTAVAPVSRDRRGKFIYGMTRVEIDEALLQQMAEMTGGQYFRAKSEASLEKIYAYIDQLEKTEIEVTSIRRYTEEYHRFAFWGLILILFEFTLKNTLLRSLP